MKNSVLTETVHQEPRIHINWTRYSERACIFGHCPTCERDRRMFGAFQEWYGWDVTCAGCGDRWSDGEMHDRPFAPGWRRKNIEYARRELAKIGVQA